MIPLWVLLPVTRIYLTENALTRGVLIMPYVPIVKKTEIIAETIGEIVAEKVKKSATRKNSTDGYQTFPLYAPAIMPPFGSESLSDFLQKQVALTLLERTQIVLQIALQLQRWHECTLENGKRLAHGEVELKHCSVLRRLPCNFIVTLELSDLLLDRLLGSESVEIFDLKKDIAQFAHLCRIIYGHAWESIPFLGGFLQRMEQGQTDSQPNAAEVVRFFMSLAQWYYLKSRSCQKSRFVMPDMRHYALLALLESGLWQPAIDCIPDDALCFVAIAYLKKRQLLNPTIVNTLLKHDRMWLSSLVTKTLIGLHHRNTLTAKALEKLSDSDWVTSQWVCTLTGLDESHYLTDFLATGIQQGQCIATGIVYFFLLVYGQGYLEQQATRRLIIALKPFEHPVENKPETLSNLTHVAQQPIKSTIHTSHHQNGFFAQSFKDNGRQKAKKKSDAIQTENAKSVLWV